MSQKRNNYDYDNNVFLELYTCYLIIIQDEQSSSSSKKNRRINKNGILGYVKEEFVLLHFHSYTNEDKPFGDDELNRPFKWLKKDDDDEYTYSKDEITNKIVFDIYKLNNTFANS